MSNLDYFNNYPGRNLDRHIRQGGYFWDWRVYQLVWLKLYYQDQTVRERKSQICRKRKP